MPRMSTPRYVQPVDAERLDNYRPGGFHPVHLGDTFNEGRYTVMHKLGFGSSATVWLVRDALTNSYASLKILSDESTTRSHETSVLLHLQGEGLGKEYVVPLIDYFQHTGPNGTHQCIVTELLGPPLSTDIEDVYPSEILPPIVAKRLIAQVTLGLNFLHKKNVVHGGEQLFAKTRGRILISASIDLHLGNLLLYSDKLHTVVQGEGVEAVYGTPRKVPFYLANEETRLKQVAPISPHAPEYWVFAAHSDSLLHLCLDDPSQTRLKIADFSESYILDVSPPPRVLCTPDIYRPPEALIPSIRESQVHANLTTDIWNLGVLFHVLLTGGLGLFMSSRREDEILCEMVFLLGRFPETLWSRWPNRPNYFDDQGNWVGGSRHHLSGKFLKLSKDVMNTAEESELLEIMLRGMVRYEGESRMKVEDVMASEWFLKYARDSTSSSCQISPVVCEPLQGPLTK
ncbi:hypothetical protein ONZ45_g9288 [Pleurotus djamor]|nr:hypothetical protein ONZ45_g9288 [Pleurotus djamor]